jgi:predicted RND superfamily exporter protein
MVLIKEIGEYLQWRWKNLDKSEKFFIPFMSWTLIIVPSIHFFGLVSFIFWFIGVAGALVVILLIIVCKEIKKSWNMFRAEQEAERQRVVDRYRRDVTDVIQR